MSTASHCHVVIASAGNGTRFQSVIPKQFHKIKGQAIISHTVEKFGRVSCVKNIVVVAPESEELMMKMKEVLQRQRTESNKIIITSGGKSRHKSIFQGLLRLKNKLTKDYCTHEEWLNEIVIIHDGVRPFVNTDDIERIIIAAKKHKAAGLVKPLVSTVLKPNSDDVLELSLDRSLYWSSEMPQAFHLGVILQAYEKCSEYDFENGTECLHIAQKYGSVCAKLLKGDSNRLWKITLQRDIAAAEALLNGYENMLLVLPNNIALRQNVSSTFGGGISVCCIKEVDELILKNMQIFWLLNIIDDLLPNMEHVINILHSHKKSCHLIIFLIDSEPLTVDDNTRLKYWDSCHQLLKFDVLTQLVVKKDLLNKGMEELLSLQTTVEKLPPGQILYF
ncbi:D-ribitol-5-phosphate cytidylyltransferase-like isoform X2 [Styela clava]|uniref:D-ribitol-5-phosphate cytidylyltransferase-like isoform X2 n=2 Tax=Styela clava TaxID=7725 RepID=UPI00193A58AA|nr:D-ribitol-5-phosphate cytidylyltransferase-like isoform X2 [Styela clava]